MAIDPRGDPWGILGGSWGDPGRILGGSWGDLGGSWESPSGGIKETRGGTDSPGLIPGEPVPPGNPIRFLNPNCKNPSSAAWLGKNK